MIGTRPWYDRETLTVWLHLYIYLFIFRLANLIKQGWRHTIDLHRYHHPAPTQVHVWAPTRSFSLSAIVLSSWHATLPHEWEEAWLKWKVLCTSAAKFSWTHCLGRNVTLRLRQQFSQYCMLKRMNLVPFWTFSLKIISVLEFDSRQFLPSFFSF